MLYNVYHQRLDFRISPTGLSVTPSQSHLEESFWIFFLSDSLDLFTFLSSLSSSPHPSWTSDVVAYVPFIMQKWPFFFISCSSGALVGVSFKLFPTPLSWLSWPSYSLEAVRSQSVDHQRLWVLVLQTSFSASFLYFVHHRRLGFYNLLQAPVRDVINLSITNVFFLYLLCACRRPLLISSSRKVLTLSSLPLSSCFLSFLPPFCSVSVFAYSQSFLEVPRSRFLYILSSRIRAHTLYCFLPRGIRSFFVIFVSIFQFVSQFCWVALLLKPASDQPWRWGMLEESSLISSPFFIIVWLQVSLAISTHHLLCSNTPALFSRHTAATTSAKKRYGQISKVSMVFLLVLYYMFFKWSRYYNVFPNFSSFHLSLLFKHAHRIETEAFARHFRVHAMIACSLRSCLCSSYTLRALQNINWQTDATKKLSW